MKQTFSHTQLECGFIPSKPICSLPPLEFPTRSLIAIMGPNGAGKTTYLKNLAALLTPLSGQIKLPQSDKPLEHQIAVVLSNRPETDYLSLYEVAALGLEAWRAKPAFSFFPKHDKKSQEIISQALFQTNLLHLANQRASTLSDGEFKRLMIARALTQNTPILLLDEPLAFLDPENKALILKLLKETADSGKTVLFTTHEPGFSLQMATHLLLIPKQPSILSPQFFSLAEGIPSTEISQCFPSDLLKFNLKSRDFNLI